MPHTLACVSTGTDCPAVFTVEDEEELWKHIEVHASSAHPDLTLDEATKSSIGSMIVAT